MAMTSARDDEAHRDIVSVFIAPPSQRPILAALVDLSSAGLIAPFHWIEADADADVEGLAAAPIWSRSATGRSPPPATPMSSIDMA